MGGPIAQLVWRRHPERVAGLVLCATSRHFRTGRGGRALQGVATGLTFAARATPRRWQHRVTERVLVSRYDTSPLGRWAREQARLNDLRMMIEAGQALGSFSSSGWIGDVEVPTSIVITERDATVPPHRQHALADAVPGARRFLVDGGHDVCAVAPDRFVPALLDACTAATGGPAVSAA